MRRIDELTDMEIYLLTDDEVDKLCDLECMANGVRFNIPYPEEAKSRMVRAVPSGKYYYIEPFGIATTDRDKAEELVEAIEELKDIYMTEYDFDLSDYVLRKKDYLVRIIEKDMYSDAVRKKLADERAKERSEEYRKALDEYTENRKKEVKIKDSVMERVYKIKQKMSEWMEIRRQLNEEYVPLVNGDREKAMTFLKKAYDVTDEMEAFINSNIDSNDAQLV